MQRSEFDSYADALEPLREQLLEFRSIIASHDEAISTVMVSGPCRDVLQNEEALEEIDGLIERSEEALKERRQGKAEPLQNLDTWDDSGVDDPTPCQPG